MKASGKKALHIEYTWPLNDLTEGTAIEGLEACAQTKRIPVKLVQLLQ